MPEEKLNPKYGDVTSDSINTERVSITPQDLSTLSLGPGDDGDLYYHNGASAITVDGSSSSSEGYVRWNNNNSEWSAVEGGSSGVSDHGNLTGLGDDDHSQYLNTTRHDAEDHQAALDSTFSPSSGDHIYYDGTSWATEQPPSGSSQSYVTARKSTNQTWSGTGTFETVTWDSLGPETLSGMDTTNNQFVPPTDGDYKITARIGTETSSSGNTTMRINDGSGNYIGFSANGNGADATNVHEVTTIRALTTSDTITVEALTDSLGDILGSDGNSEFIVEQLA